MFDHDHSAARGEMASRRLIVFRHAGQLGNASAHTLFDMVKVWRVDPQWDERDGERLRHPIGSKNIDNWPPARSFADYEVSIDRAGLPEGVEVLELL